MSSKHGTGSQFPGFARFIVEKGDPVSISTLYLSILHIRLHHIEDLKSNIITTLRNIGLKGTDLYKAIWLSPFKLEDKITINIISETLKTGFLVSCDTRTLYPLSHVS